MSAFRDFRSDDSSLFQAGRFADAIIECGSTTFKIHKAIVCQRSDWFMKALDGQFQETALAKVVIEDFSPEQMRWLLGCLYSGRLDGVPKASEGCSLKALVEASVLADYFMMQELRGQIACKLWKLLTKVTRLLQITSAQHGHNAHAISQATERFLVGFFKAVKDAYQSQHHNTALRNHFVEFGVRTRHILVHNTAFAEGLLEVPQFAAELFIQCEKGLRYENLDKETKCSKCANLIFAKGVHLARPVQSNGGSECVCSKCFAKEND